ncbi:16S rRNA (guanine(527)-N(7))-methyltransferase [hydrothermal vent metagenome]|uniref:16S rRNA (Guanine(527)-N(7))-methyltransferase n=1 Tax=hydrothermal vent metagenome TaxID=652676 RepID=A0A3B0TZM8_9ZZZZ
MARVDRWGPDEVAAEFDVSHETLDRLGAYVLLLRKWSQSINLVGARTLDDVWGRHIADSLQLVALAPDEARTWVDMGSGGGLPGLVVAAALSEVEGFKMHLVEANARKCAFLHVAARAMKVPVEVHNRRIEDLGRSDTRPRADVVSARALAPLAALCDLAEPFMWKNTVCLFLKGQDVESELTQGPRYRTMTIVQTPSVVPGVASSAGGGLGTILRIEGAAREQEN